MPPRTTSSTSALFLLSGPCAAVVVSILLPLTQDRSAPADATGSSTARKPCSGRLQPAACVRPGRRRPVAPPSLESPARASIAATAAIITWLVVERRSDVSRPLARARAATSPLIFLRKVVGPTARADAGLRAPRPSAGGDLARRPGRRRDPPRPGPAARRPLGALAVRGGAERRRRRRCAPSSR